MFSDGINLVYYYDMNAKINFLEVLLQEYKKSKILFLDFDTQFTAFQANDLLDLNFKTVPGLEIFLPYSSSVEGIIDKILQFDKFNSLIVLDSLNGLIDYFSLPADNSRDTVKKSSHSNLNKNQQIYSKFAGYKSLIFLSLLLQESALKTTPQVVTYYQSPTSIDRLKLEIISNKKLGKQEDNHFRRISNKVILVEYDEQVENFRATVIK